MRHINLYIPIRGIFDYFEAENCAVLHTLCFIRNAYKERFSPLVKFLEKLRNGLVIFQKNKERKKGRAN